MSDSLSFLDDLTDEEHDEMFSFTGIPLDPDPMKRPLYGLHFAHWILGLPDRNASTMNLRVVTDLRLMWEHSPFKTGRDYRDALRENEPLASAMAAYARHAIDSGELDRHRQDEGADELWTPVPTADRTHLLDEPLAWLVEGVMPAGDFGWLGGNEKTLKSIMAMHQAVAVASGEPFLGVFPIPERKDVHYLVGEGGERLFVSRAQRIAEAYGLTEIPKGLTHSTDLAGMQSDEALRAVDRIATMPDLGLLIMDPWYTFHGGGADASNLFQQGALLTTFHKPLADAGIAFEIVHHTTKATEGPPTRRSLTQSGAAEWGSMWTLLWHMDDPKPDIGEYTLGFRIGSRHGFERYLTVNYSDGPLRQRQGSGAVAIMDVEHERLPTWTVADSDSSIIVAPSRGAGKRPADYQEAILHYLVDNPWRETKNEIVRIVSGDGKHLAIAISELQMVGIVGSVEVSRANARGARRNVVVYGVTAKGVTELPAGAYPNLSGYPSMPAEGTEI